MPQTRNIEYSILRVERYNETMIRRAFTRDVESVWRLANEFVTSFKIEESIFRVSFEALTKDENALVAVAEFESEVVGYVLALRHQTFYANGAVVWVAEIAVDARLRRRGFGKALMRKVELWALEYNCQLVTLATRRAEDFYAALGYQASATYLCKVIR